ncbi:hypothetical protein ACJRO7_003976 [Eucalyptus globulus]|uniref:GH18 domain-containing protein n=1 Tax=Eucalyptus globulus TaxID=34317 RepID=A0ABD3IVM4_EUCGL
MINLAGHCNPTFKGRVGLSSDFQGLCVSETGLFDYVWVQFYNNPPCQYNSSAIDNLEDAWKQWITIPAKQILSGLSASPNAVGSGYVRQQFLVRKFFRAFNDILNTKA